MKLSVGFPSMPSGMPLYLLLAGVGLLIYLASRQRPGGGGGGSSSEMPAGGPSGPRVEVFMGEIQRLQ